MFKDLKNIIYDKDIKLILTDQKLDINNYTKIILVDDNKIIIDIKNNIYKITGTNLKITKLLDNELLIDGDIKTINRGE